MDNQIFRDWLRDEMRDRGWSLMDLHRESGLDSGGLSNLLQGKRNPGVKTCKALAKAFRIPEEDVLQMAGLLNNVKFNPKDALIVEITTIYDKLDEENRRELLEYARMKMKIQGEKHRHEEPTGKPQAALHRRRS